eukprot:NODE_3889_length_877_cov_58.409333_g3736_i0.p1 GENE.NODE_3889_length_877_cov_58.409333_g3736_i0~~NODE_3889_length_877_cov_58.409333_g3736_i0.p1  ORF type:complete len:264 (+),score=60.32 NODE_3889_length_877_cov_58.409333_g3736_i0:34-792(+)
MGTCTVCARTDPQLLMECQQHRLHMLASALHLPCTVGACPPSERLSGRLTGRSEVSNTSPFFGECLGSLTEEPGAVPEPPPTRSSQEARLSQLEEELRSLRQLLVGGSGEVSPGVVAALRADNQRKQLQIDALQLLLEAERRKGLSKMAEALTTLDPVPASKLDRRWNRTEAISAPTLEEAEALLIETWSESNCSSRQSLAHTSESGITQMLLNFELNRKSIESNDRRLSLEEQELLDRQKALPCHRQGPPP